MHLVGLGLQPVEEAAHAVPHARPGAAPVLPGVLAFQHPMLLFVGEVAPGHVEGDAGLLRHHLHVVLAFGIARRLPGLHRALLERLALVRHHQPEVDADHPAKAAAGLAGAQGRIEGKQAGQRLAIGDVAIGAVKVLRKAPHRALIALAIHHPHRHAPLPGAQRRLHRLADAGGLRRAGAEAILNHPQPVPLAAMDAGVTLLLQIAANLVFGEVGRHIDGKGHMQARVTRLRRPRRHRRRDAVRRIPLHMLAAALAVQMPGAGEQQLEVVGELRHGAHRRARGAHRIGLVNRNRRRHALDTRHMGLVHAVQKLARIGRKGLHIPPLPLGIQRVEHQRRLAGAGRPGEHHQRPQRDLQIQILQIVLGRADDADDIGGVAVGHGGL